LLPRALIPNYYSLQLWDTASGQRIGQPITDASGVVFSPDGRTIVTKEATPGILTQWDVASQQPIGSQFSLSGGSGLNLGTYAFSPDGRMLVTAGRDGRVRLWGVASHGEIDEPITVPEPIYYFSQVALSPDGRTLATAGKDDTVRLWSVPSS
jgi:WD40 repeat protein